MSRGRARLGVSYEACAASVAAARNAVSLFAARNGASNSELERVRLAVSEAVTNAVVHAYPAGAPGPIHLTAALAGRELSVIVADDGCGIENSRESPGLGFGLNLIEHTCASFTLTAARSGGTQLEMRFLLSASAAQPDPIETVSPHRVASLRPLRLAAFFHDATAEGGT